MADILYTGKQTDANCGEEDTTMYRSRLFSGNGNGCGCVKTCDFVPCSSGEGVNLGIDSIVKGEPTSSSGTRSRSRSSTGTLCTDSLREDIKHDIIGRESESVGVDEEHLSVKEEPSFECLCDAKAETNDKLNVESESSQTLRHSVVKDEPICTEEEDVKPVIKPECLTDIYAVKTEPLFGHFPDFGDEVIPKVENFVKEEVSEWEVSDFVEVEKTEGQVGDVEDTCTEPVFVQDHMSQVGGLQLQISNVRSLCLEQSASPDTDVVASSSPTSTFSADPVTSSGSVVWASWDHGESSDVSTYPHRPLTSCHPVQQTSDMLRRQGQSSSCRFQTGQRVYEENVGSVRKEISSGNIGAVERVCDLHQNIAGDKQMDNRNLYHGWESPYEFKVCGEMFSEVGNLQTHEKNHSRDRPHQSEVCGAAFTKSRHLQDHKGTHEGERPYKCEVCGATFTRGSHLLNHKRIHIGEKPYKCEVCGATFTQSGNLQRHKRTHTGEKPYKCEVCGATFTFSSSLQRHKRTHTGEKPYQCKVCGVTFTQSGHLQNHKRTHTGEKPYRCEVCGATFTYGSSLLCHKRTHSGEKPYMCEVCGATFTCSSSLRNHKRTHTKEKPYKCEVCGETFTCNKSQQRHKRIHTGENPYKYKCEVCGATFTCSSNLQRHKRTHTIENPYKCEVCGATFRQSGNLQRHKRIHTGEKPYKCEVCGATFTRSRHLQDHKRIHTGENPYKWEVCGATFTKTTNETPALPSLQSVVPVAREASINYKAVCRSHPKVQEVTVTVNSYPGAEARDFLSSITVNQNLDLESRVVNTVIKMADISYTSKQMDANCEEDTTITMYRLNSGNDNGSGCVKTCDLFVPCSSGEGVNLGIDSIVVKSELTSSSGTRSRCRSSTGTLCTNSLREDVKHDIIGRESESVGVDEEHLSVKEEPSFECPCNAKAETNDKLNVESESSLTLRHSVVKDEPICTEEEDVKPVIKPECLADICAVKTEPLFGHFPDFGDEVKPKMENFVKEEVSEWEGPDVVEVGKTEGQVGDVEDTCTEPVFVEDRMSQAGGLQLKISNVRSLCMEQSASPDTDVVASSSPTSTFCADPVTSSGSVVRTSWDHGESSDVSTSPHRPLTSCHSVQQTSDMQGRQGQSSSCRFQTGQRVYEENVGSVRKETSSGDIGDVERVCDLHQNIAGDKQMDNRNLYHGREKPHECKVSGEMFSEVGNLQTHEKKHTRDRPHQSEVCGAAFTKSRRLQDHKGTHTGEKPYKCEVCGATFTRGSNLQSHKRSHTGERPYKCEVCGATFTLGNSLKRHKRTHTGEKPYKCEVCGATFSLGDSLKRHKRTHTGEKPYKCEVCGSTFTCGRNLQDHERIHTGEKPYKCEVCGAMFTCGRNLQIHKRTHSGEKLYKCEVCGASFKRSGHLQSHKRTHTGEKPYKCEVCSATFTQNAHLQRHKRTHTGEKPYKCEVCGASFKRSGHLQSHKKTHTGEKHYKCEVCGAMFTQNANLQRHKRTHTGEKPYKCEVCGVAFSLGDSLKHHKRTHTGEKPYKCEVCGATFTRGSSLLIHKRTHSGEKPYKCEVCDVTFTQSAHLQRHKRTHTGERLYTV
ncbi:uncharacterized protein LOC101859793 [Aplysia californica]|uniref:Uncharacterized protein LOC101859793 n=1 Tax=Aplysia californica TaxID=6500 RepID=A0ABM1A2V3_APLCA|nr:uncharacterized protein LOC101859793 [Aplysia californica]